MSKSQVFTGRSLRRLSFLPFLAAVLTLFAFDAAGQQNLWSVNYQRPSDIPAGKAVRRQSFPDEFKLFDLNIGPLRQELFSIVGGDAARKGSTVITVPNAAGDVEYFEVFEASNFEPELQARFPEIRSFSGRGISDPYATLKLSISPRGVEGTVFRNAAEFVEIAAEAEYIEPYSADRTTYAVFRSERKAGQSPWACTTEEELLFSGWKSKIASTDALMASTGQLRTLRLVQSCNGEYARYFGASTSGTAADEAIVMAAINKTLTRSNGVYEKDLGVHLNLTPETTRVFFYNPQTDPYGTQISGWNNQLRNAIANANITPAMYDIGHMFGASGGGGNAGCIGCVCSADHNKGGGITSPADAIPEGDNFDIDYVVHEVGHQLGANHTFSMSNEGTGVNKEVGSGITIMGYAGITSQDVAPHSIDVFHQASIGQIQSNLPTRPCPAGGIVQMTQNAPPVVNALTNYTIPITTPFALTGSATDPNGDPLTYNWEQNDNSTTTGALSVASPTKLTGPNWLTFPSSASGTRLFPRLSTILAGQAVTGPLPGGDSGANIEALSSVSRTLNFRLTVRDNHPYVPGQTIGQTNFRDMTVTVTNTAGPFRVTSPDTNVSWAGGSIQNVTWNVANTNLVPVSTANVRILMSTDGGNNFTHELAASTPNDGSQTVTIPTGATSTARIKVEAVGNIYFDISNANFTVTGGGDPTPTPTPTPGGGTCTPELTVTEERQGSLGAFTSITAGQGTVTVDPANVKPGLQSFTLVSSSNANVNIPAFSSGTFNPVTATFTVPNTASPVDFTLRAQSKRNAVLIRAQCTAATAATGQAASRPAPYASLWMPSANAPAIDALISLFRLAIAPREDGGEIAKS